MAQLAAFFEAFFFLKLDDSVFDAIGIGDLKKYEAFLLTGCLDVDISVIQERGNDADNLGSDILNLGELQLRNVAVEKSLLADVDDAFIRHNPSVEIEIKPQDEEKIPDKKRPRLSPKRRRL